MNKKRLLILAEFLDTVPKEKFSLESWRDSDLPSSNRSDDALLDRACGTTGCAVGWACVIPELKAEGLSWQDNPQYKTFGGWGAVKQFFDISDELSTTLFSDSKYSLHHRGPKNVANRIRNYLNVVHTL